MGMRKKQRVTPCERCYHKFTDLDMFGEHPHFNISGRAHFGTCCGVIFTLAIIIVTVAAFYFTAIRGMQEHEVPTIIHEIKREYYEPGRDVY